MYRVQGITAQNVQICPSQLYKPSLSIQGAFSHYQIRSLVTSVQGTGTANIRSRSDDTGVSASVFPHHSRAAGSGRRQLTVGAHHGHMCPDPANLRKLSHRQTTPNYCHHPRHHGDGKSASCQKASSLGTKPS